MPRLLSFSASAGLTRIDSAWTPAVGDRTKPRRKYAVGSVLGRHFSRSLLRRMPGPNQVCSRRGTDRSSSQPREYPSSEAPAHSQLLCPCPANGKAPAKVPGPFDPTSALAAEGDARI